METKEMYWNGMLIRKDRASKVYQEMCGEVLGKDTVHIERGVMNRVLMHLMFVDSFGSFQDYLKALLERLNKKMTSAGAEFELLVQVEAVADPWWGEYAFAKLVAWDTLWDLIMLGAVGLESFTVSLMDDIPCDKNPYELAHKKKNMVFEKCGAMIVEEGKTLAVLVTAPWNSNKCCGYNDANYLLYRSLTRRTFFEYLYDNEKKLKDIVEDYEGEELVVDVIAKLNGVIVIDMAAEEGKVICHSFGNPNSAVWDEMDEMTLHKVVNNGDINGVCDTFDHDNY